MYGELVGNCVHHAPGAIRVEFRARLRGPIAFKRSAGTLDSRLVGADGLVRGIRGGALLGGLHGRSHAFLGELFVAVSVRLGALGLRGIAGQVRLRLRELRLILSHGGIRLRQRLAIRPRIDFK